MSGEAFLGSCLICGEKGEVIWALDAVKRDKAAPSTTQVVIRLDSSPRPPVETREVPARFFKVTRCKNRKACDARVAAIEARERAGQAETSPAMPEPMQPIAVPAADVPAAPAAPDDWSWFE